MLMIIFIYFITILMLIRGWQYPTECINKPSYTIFNLLFCLILIIFVAFRDGHGMPDYDYYLYWFNKPKSRAIEISFIYIINFIKDIGFPYIALFIIYAILSVGIRYYAIIKYSPLVWFSFASWFCFILILHDMIQIRAAVSSALLLLIIPSIYNKKYIRALFLILIAILFHRSSIIYFILFFVNTKKDYWNIWVLLYVIFTVLSILRVDIFSYIGIDTLSVIEGEDRKMSAEEGRPNMFAPLTLIQTITCFILLFRIKQVSKIYPMSIIWLKIGFLSLIIYGTGIFVVSVRLAELLSTVYIILFPLLYFVFKGKRRFFHGKILVTCIILAYLTNYIFFRQFIPYNN